MRLEHVTAGKVFLKAIVYARFGVGKTRLCGTAAEHPEMGDVLLVRCEDGHATITHQDCMMTPKIKSIGEIRQLFWDLAGKKTATISRVDEKGEQVKEKYDFGKVKTIIIDSGSALLQTCLEETVEKNCKGKPEKDPDRVTVRDWGDANFVMTKLFRQFFDLDMNVLLTALVRDDYDTDDSELRMKRGPRLTRPDFNPKLADRVMSFADFVWWMDAKNDGTRVLHTQPKGPWVAKTRGDVFASKLPKSIDNPNLPQIYDLLQDVQPKEAGK